MSLAVAWLLGPLMLLACWLACMVVLGGIGLLLRAFVAPRARLGGRLMIACFWAGAAAAVFVLQLWHLVLPVDAAAGVVLLIAGAAGLFIARPDVRDWWLRVQSPGPAQLLLVLLSCWWAGGEALGAVGAFDTYMYHVPMVDWLRAYPIVPGLANLQERFGFNNASFLLAAVLESGPWAESSPHLLNGTFLVPALALGFASLRDTSRRQALSRADVVDLVVLAAALAMAGDVALFRSIGPDAPAALALFAGVSFLLRCFDASLSAETRAFFGMAAAGAFAAGAAFKLSVAAAALPFAVAALVAVVRLRVRPATAMAFVLSIGIGGAWLVRGAILSGYPLYPSTAIALPVDWRVPEEQARASYAWVSFFARWFDDPQTYNRGYVAPPCTALSWLGPWLRTLTHPTTFWRLGLPVILAAVFAAVGLRSRTRTGAAPAWLLLPLLFAALVWFIVAPRPLFGFWIFWLAAALLATHAVGVVRGGRILPAGALALAACSLALPMLGRGLDAARATSESNIRAALSVWRIPAEPGSWIQPTRWAYPLTPYTTRSGLQLLVPAGSRCGRAPLECTSHPAPNLELRGADVRDGFRVRGEWQAERWPNPWSGFLAAWRAGRVCPATEELEATRQ